MKPRYYQQESHDAAWDFLSNQPGSPLIVLPTGSGKSLVLAMLARQARAFDARVIILQHRKELIEQNAEKVQLLMPEIEVGIHSAGLKKHATDEDVVVAGIQSVYRKAHEFGRRELILIDEVHLVGNNSESMYGQFLHDLRVINQKARIVGLTATPFRTGEGPICGPQKLFQRICYEAQTGDLIEQGFLCPVTNKVASGTVDTSQIKIRGSEFINGEAQKVFNVDDKVALACKEIVERCHDRKSVLIFASGVDHAANVAEVIRELTEERVGVVTGETFAMEREKFLTDFKTGRLRWIVNCDVLTTGFDAPRIDAIAILRATMSPGLFAQIVGRGLRKHESKTDCLILDFGGNISRHGSLDDPEYGRASVSRGTSSGEVAAAEKNGRGRPCPNCEIDVATGQSECPECGFQFPKIRSNHGDSADTESQLLGTPEPQQWNVSSCSWGLHRKKNAANAPPTLKVSYEARPVDAGEGNLLTQVINEWVCFEHSGFARNKAEKWWTERSIDEVPDTVEEAVQKLDNHVARMPSVITTQKDGKWDRIESVEFVDPRPEEWNEHFEEFHFDSDEEVPF